MYKFTYICKINHKFTRIKHLYTHILYDIKVIISTSTILVLF